MRHYHLITVYQPTSTGTHFSTLALAIFLIAWRYNTRLSITPGILLASDLTYSVYLMHNWSWDPLKNLVQKLSIDRVHPDIQTLCALLALCFILSKLVEKPGVKSGRIALNAIRAKKRKKVSG
jgi:surface polysaccharide O-acyltransferase-like enzyme